MSLETNTTPPKSPVRRSLRLQKRAPSTEALSSSPKQNSVKNLGTANTESKEKLKQLDVELKSDLAEDVMSNIKETFSNLPVIEEQISLEPETIETPVETILNEELLEKKEGNEHTDINNEVQKTNLKTNQVNGFVEKQMKIVKNETKKLDINDKIDELLMNVSDSDNESHHNSLLDSMAEEGEEDTPSEGSNDIIEVGEEINTTESEFSSDESYENNSFIDDDEDNHQLLSGEEFDISLDDGTKRRRIIQLSSGSDDGIVKIIKKKKHTKKKKSRIIRFEDSSDEEVTQNCEIKVSESSADPICSVVKDKGSGKECEMKNEDFLELDRNIVTSTPNNCCINNNKKIVVLENIRVQDDKELTDKVNNILTSICTEIKNVSSSDPCLNIKSSSELKQNDLEEKKEKPNKIRTQNHQNRKQKRNRRKQNQNTSFHIANKNYFKFENQTETCAKKSKKRKRKVLDSEEKPRNTKKSKIQLHNAEAIVKESNEGWEEEYLVVKPSIDNVKRKAQNQICKFNVKDFKGLMLFDQKRVRRMDIRHLLKKVY